MEMAIFKRNVEMNICTNKCTYNGIGFSTTKPIRSTYLLKVSVSLGLRLHYYLLR